MIREETLYIPSPTDEINQEKEQTAQGRIHV
jgi:hypothetical protein